MSQCSEEVYVIFGSVSELKTTFLSSLVWTQAEADSEASEFAGEPQWRSYFYGFSAPLAHSGHVMRCAFSLLALPCRMFASFACSHKGRVKTCKLLVLGVLIIDCV